MLLIYLWFLYSLFSTQLGKSVIAKVAISKGTVLSPDMFAVKVGEPKGIPPENMQNLVGKKIKVDVKEDDSILADMIEWITFKTVGIEAARKRGLENVERNWTGDVNR